VGSFTRTPDGCVLSLTFDNFHAPIASKAELSVVKFTIASSDAAVGQTITFDISGAMANAAGSKIHLKVGNRQFELEPKSDEFRVPAQAPASSAETPV
jgi:hypothetical protein